MSRLLISLSKDRFFDLGELLFLKKIWITRPKKDAHRFYDALQNAGLLRVYEPVIEPLLDVEHLDVDLGGLLSQSSIGAVIATSRNAVRAISQETHVEQLFHLPFFAVGQSTGDLAKSLGFEDVRVGDGRGADLLPLIREFDGQAKTAEPKKLLLLRGDIQAVDLKSELEKGEPALKHQVVEILCYQMREAEQLSDEMLRNLRAGNIKVVVLLSPRTAKVYKQLIGKYGLGAEASGLQHFCLSEAVSDVLKFGPENERNGFNPIHIEISEFPSQDHLIDCIKLYSEA